MSFPEDVESDLVELGINVRDYKNYREAQLAEVMPFLKSRYVQGLRTGLAA